MSNTATAAPRVDAALRAGTARLMDCSDSPELDAQLLLAKTLDWPRSRLFAYPEVLLTAAQQQHFEQLLKQRQAGQPVAYLLGEQEFWSLPLSVSDAVLVPRADTEELVAWALNAAGAQAQVLDLGTGSGAIAIALAHERPQWTLCASDRSAAALQLAAANARRHGLQIEWAEGSWLQPWQGRRFDLILSNPPYLAADDPHLPALRHEPASALVAGDDGLADLRQIIREAPAHLHDGGALALEHGLDQGAAVRALLQAAGFKQVATQHDLAGHERVSHGRWQSA